MLHYFSHRKRPWNSRDDLLAHFLSTCKLPWRCSWSFFSSISRDWWRRRRKKIRRFERHLAWATRLLATRPTRFSSAVDRAPVVVSSKIVDRWNPEEVGGIVETWGFGYWGNKWWCRFSTKMTFQCDHIDQVRNISHMRRMYGLFILYERWIGHILNGHVDTLRIMGSQKLVETGDPKDRSPLKQILKPL